MSNEKYVTSSNVLSVSSQNNNLFVKFHGNSLYVYYNAAQHYDGLINASSIGSYLNTYVKPYYECKKIY